MTLDLKRKHVQTPTAETPVTSSVAPNDGTPFGHLSDADMLREMARRLGKGGVDLAAIEDLAEQVQRHMGEETLAAALAALGPETASRSRARGAAD